MIVANSAKCSQDRDSSRIEYLDGFLKKMFKQNMATEFEF